MAARYRQFLRLCDDWPLDKTKQTGRDLGAYIREQVAKAFREGEATKLENDQLCGRHYESLLRIRHDHYREKYPRLKDTGCTSLTADQCRVVVSAEALAFMEEQDQNVLKRLASRMKGQVVKSTDESSNNTTSRGPKAKT